MPCTSQEKTRSEHSLFAQHTYGERVRQGMEETAHGSGNGKPSNIVRNGAKKKLKKQKIGKKDTAGPKLNHMIRPDGCTLLHRSTCVHERMC